MTARKNEPFKYLAGLIFILAVVAELAFYIQLGKLLGSFSIGTQMWIDMAGKALIGIAMLAEVPALVLVGSIVSLISLAMRMVSGGVWLYGVFWTIFWIVLAISYVNKKYARVVCFTAGVVELAHFGWAVFHMNTARLSFTGIYMPLSILLLAIGAFFMGMALPEMRTKTKDGNVVLTSPQVDTEDKLAQIEKLNELLEKGYITKEEFDAKKEQIMKS